MKKKIQCENVDYIYFLYVLSIVLFWEGNRAAKSLDFINHCYKLHHILIFGPVQSKLRFIGSLRSNGLTYVSEKKSLLWS